MKISILGAGSFGCALAEHLNSNGHSIKLWGRNEIELKELESSRKLPKSLGSGILSKNISISFSLDNAIYNTELIIFAVPSLGIRQTANKIKNSYNDQICLIVAKGAESNPFKTLDEVVKEELKTDKIAVLSGPTHAEEVIRKMPSSAVIASDNILIAQKLQSVFMNDNFRIYTSNDIKGVELGGAIKNIIALAAGISDGLGYGDNAKAALITRGVVEVARLSESMGANPKTLTGLTGLGDLIVTCASKYSRNRMCGFYIGQGYSIDEAIKKVGMVVEGINALEAIYLVAKSNNIETPIINAVFDVINGNINVADITTILINREPKKED